MELVESYKRFLERLRDKYEDSDRIVCLLFLDPFNDDLMGNYISHRFDYFHERTGKHVDFFCPGYNKHSERRGFVTKDFVDFINEFERITNWRYYGGTNLLLIRYSGHQLHFDSVYDINFTRMLLDGLIKDHRHFIEEIIFRFREDIEDYLDGQFVRRQIQSVWMNFSELLPNFARKITKQIDDSININRYFLPHDISKKDQA